MGQADGPPRGTIIVLYVLTLYVQAHLPAWTIGGLLLCQVSKRQKGHNSRVHFDATFVNHAALEAEIKRQEDERAAKEAEKQRHQAERADEAKLKKEAAEKAKAEARERLKEQREAKKREREVEKQRKQAERSAGSAAKRGRGTS